MKLLLFLFSLVTVLAVASFFRRPVEVDVKDMFYACDPCNDNYKVLKSYTPASQRLVGKDVAIRYHGQHLSEHNDFVAPDPAHAKYRIAGTVALLGHTIEATRVQKLWKEDVKGKAQRSKQ